MSMDKDTNQGVAQETPPAPPVPPAPPDAAADALIAPASANRMALRSAVILLAFITVFTALLSATYLSLRSTIEDAFVRGEKMQLIDEILPRSAYDNDLLADTIEIAPTSALAQKETTIAYRARRAGKPVALVLEAIAPNGYSGRIWLVLAVAPDGRLLGVRVTRHKETPGRGDYIDPKKDKNKRRPWIKQFAGADPVNTSEGDWRVKKDGGRFDAMVGATISARAVVKAVRKAALYVAENRETLFAP